MERKNQGNSNDNNDKKSYKITFVGDSTVGKTCILTSYRENKFQEDGVPTVIDNHVKDIKVDNQVYSMTLWDTSGDESYEKLRPLSYPKIMQHSIKTDCFILCYAVDNPASLTNIEIKWMPELRHHCPNVPIVLVVGHLNRQYFLILKIGAKSDLLSPKDEKAELDGKNMHLKIKASSFIMCSAKTRENLNDVFEECLRIVVNPPPIANGLNCCKMS